MKNNLTASSNKSMLSFVNDNVISHKVLVIKYHMAMGMAQWLQHLTANQEVTGSNNPSTLLWMRCPKTNAFGIQNLVLKLFIPHSMIVWVLRHTHKHQTSVKEWNA